MVYTFTNNISFIMDVRETDSLLDIRRVLCRVIMVTYYVYVVRELGVSFTRGVARFIKGDLSPLIWYE